MTEETRMTVPEFYANTIRTNVSAFEVELQTTLSDSAGGLKAALNLRMSPQTAWVLARTLQRQLAEYEKRFGAIALPEEIRKEFAP